MGSCCCTTTEFNGKTTAMEATDDIDLYGKVVILTGCNTGIGKETARVLAIRGAKVYMACRNQEKATAARQDLIQSIQAIDDHKNFDGSTLIPMPLDLSSLHSVRQFVVKYLSLNERIDYLILNAGIMNTPQFTPSAEGYELQFAVNHLGHFYLTLLLTPLLKTCAPSRVIAVASNASGFAPKLGNEDSNWITDGIQRNDGPLWLGSYMGQKGAPNYGVSKACNVLFAREYNARYFADGVHAVSLHPGVIGTTQLFKTSTTLMQNACKTPGITKSIEQGAATTIRCVSLSVNEICGGHYYKDCQEANDTLRTDLKANRGNENDNSLECKLWEWSELLITSKGFALDMNTSATANKVDENVNMECKQNEPFEIVFE